MIFGYVLGGVWGCFGGIFWIIWGYLGRFVGGKNVENYGEKKTVKKNFKIRLKPFLKGLFNREFPINPFKGPKKPPRWASSHGGSHAHRHEHGRERDDCRNCVTSAEGFPRATAG